MATLASLVVSLEANVARFESDLNKAEFMAKKAMDTIGNVSETAMKTVKGAVMAMAAAYTFDAFADGIKGAIASAGELDQMAKKTGATVEALSGLKSAAKLSGTSLEEVGGGLQKLSKAMFEAAASRIFINYRRDDAGGVAGRLADSLEAYFGDGRVFRDIGGIEGGANFEEVLRQTAQSADAMIVLIGRNWVSAVNKAGQRRLDDPEDWVAREIAAALERKIPIFPVLIEDAVMPRAEELPELLKPLARHNAITITDSRWSSDVTRLAKVVAIDIPGSEAERQLQYLQRVISIALLAAITFTTTMLVLNVAEHAPQIVKAAEAPNKPSLEWPLALWQSGVTFVVVLGCVILLFSYAHLVDPSRKRFFYISGFAGVLGTLFCFVRLYYLSNDLEPIYTFLGSTVTATVVLVLMNFSGFKAR